MYKEKEALGANVILKKYCLVDRRRSSNPDKLLASSNWKAIELASKPLLMVFVGVWAMGLGSESGRIVGLEESL